MAAVTSQTSALPYAQRSEANPAVTSSLAIAVIAAATIAGAWFFQLVLEILPCELCLEQRYAYYVSIPLALLTAVAAKQGASRAVLVGLFAVLALVLAANAVLGVYH